MDQIKNVDYLQGFGLGGFNYNWTEKVKSDLEKYTITHILAKMTPLEELSIECDSFCQTTESTANCLITTLDKLTNFKKLELKFQYNVTKEGFATVFQIPARLPKLQSLNLTFTELGDKQLTTEKSLEEFGRGLAKMTELRELNLSLKSLKGKQDSAALSFFSSESKITDNGLEFFSECIGNLTELRILDLCLSRWSDEDISDKGLIVLSQNIGKLQKLKKLDLNLEHFGSKTLTDDGFKFFCENLDKLIEVQDLNLNLGYLAHKNCNLSVSTVSRLTSSICSMPNLKTLNLNLNDWDFESAISNMGDSISLLKEKNPEAKIETYGYFQYDYDFYMKEN